MKPIFLDSGSLGGEGGSCMRGHGLLSLYSSYIKFKKKTLFSLSLTAIVQRYAAKLLENIFLCFVPNQSFREGIEEAKQWPKCTQNLGFEFTHLIGQNKHSKFTYNTLRILPVTVICERCADKPTWGHIPQLFATFEP